MKAEDLETAVAVTGPLQTYLSPTGNNTPLVVTMFEGAQRDPAGFLLELW